MIVRWSHEPSSAISARLRKVGCRRGQKAIANRRCVLRNQGREIGAYRLHYTVDEICVAMGVSAPVVMRWSKGGLLAAKAPAHIRNGHGYEIPPAALREFRPDLVSAHTAKAGWAARAACRWLGIPAIYTPHGLSVGARARAPLRMAATLAERAARLENLALN